jgi:hypothetical protein
MRLPVIVGWAIEWEQNYETLEICRTIALRPTSF